MLSTTSGEGRPDEQRNRFRSLLARVALRLRPRTVIVAGASKTVNRAASKQDIEGNEICLD